MIVLILHAWVTSRFYETEYMDSASAIHAKSVIPMYSKLSLFVYIVCYFKLLSKGTSISWKKVQNLIFIFLFSYHPPPLPQLMVMIRLFSHPHPKPKSVRGQQQETTTTRYGRMQFLDGSTYRRGDTITICRPWHSKRSVKCAHTFSVTAG